MIAFIYLFLYFSQVLKIDDKYYQNSKWYRSVFLIFRTKMGDQEQTCLLIRKNDLPDDMNCFPQDSFMHPHDGVKCQSQVFAPEIILGDLLHLS